MQPFFKEFSPKKQAFKACRKFLVYKWTFLWYTVPRSVRQADLSTQEMYPFPGNIISDSNISGRFTDRWRKLQTAGTFPVRLRPGSQLHQTGIAVSHFIFSRRNFAISEGVGGFSECRRLLCCVAQFGL